MSIGKLNRLGLLALIQQVVYLSLIKKGLLYNWYAVTNVKGIAPAGYHIPTVAEFTALVNYLVEEAGNKLKAIDPSWSLLEGVTNSSGFTALAAGFRYDEGTFLNEIEQGKMAVFWSSDYESYYMESPYPICPGFLLLADGDPGYTIDYSITPGVGETGDDPANNACSIRCIRDSSEGWTGRETVKDYDGNVYNTVKIGNQVWLKQNLAVTHYNDGTLIPEVTDPTAWNNINQTGALCAFNNNWNNV